ncbi:MAG TPA: carbohydrate ABC transporter permease [Phycisphaerales bacterium]|nr:carbohydrate ABC transporter permease [Phycisphaerales bacterium]
MTHPRPPSPGHSKRTRLARPVLYALLILVALAYALPLVWMASTSIKPANEALSQSIGLLPRLAPLPASPAPAGEVVRAQREPEGEVAQSTYISRLLHQIRQNYADVLASPVADFRLYMRNSFIVSSLSVLGMTLSSAIVAYGFSRIRWRGRDTTFILVLATMMIPFTVIMAPQYLLFKHLGWIGTLKPLWVPAWFAGGFSIFLLRQFFMGIPRELDEAARIDGCSHVATFRHIILPLARPALVVVALLQFIATWNDFSAPLVFLNHQDTFTAALGLHMYQTQQTTTPWNLVMAASIMVIAPVLVLFLIAQRSLIEGVATQGLKD